MRPRIKSFKDVETHIKKLDERLDYLDKYKQDKKIYGYKNKKPVQDIAYYSAHYSISGH